MALKENPQYIEISSGENESKVPDYVIAYYKAQSKSSEQLRIIGKLLKAIKDKKFEVKEENSMIDGSLWYILVYVDKDNLKDRAEIARIPITLRHKVKDLKRNTRIDNGNDSPRDNHDNDSTIRKRSWLKQFLKDWFSTNLYNGYVKVEYKESLHERLEMEVAAGKIENPFEDSKVRGHLTHDLLKDINISDGESRSTEYMGLEWMRENGYIDKCFICHNMEDKQKSKKKREIDEDNPASPVKQHLQSVTWIRIYFGEKVAFMFAWHSVYLSYGLSLPAIVGNEIGNATFHPPTFHPFMFLR